MRKLTIIISLLMLCSLTACLQPSTPQKMLIGSWRSIEMGGGEMSEVQDAFFVFDKEGNFLNVLQLASHETLSLDTKYIASDSEITILPTANDQGAVGGVMKYEFEDGVLKLTVQKNGHWVRLKRVK